jgi:uncharacterized protein YjbJ (UPF0337 family)
MNRDQLEGRWEQLKGKVHERWGQLTNDDIEKVKGQARQLAGAIQERYGISKDEAERQIEEFCETC